MKAGNCRAEGMVLGVRLLREIALGCDLQNILKFCVMTEASNFFVWLVFLFFLILNVLKMLDTLKSLSLSLVHTRLADCVVIISQCKIKIISPASPLGC